MSRAFMFLTLSLQLIEILCQVLLGLLLLAFDTFEVIFFSQLALGGGVQRGNFWYLYLL